MEEPRVSSDQPLIANHEPSEVADPGKGALHDPAPLVAAQLAAVLMRGLLVVRPGRDDRFNTAADQGSPQGITIKALVRNQPLRMFAGAAGPVGSPDRYRVQRLFEKPHLRRGCRVQVCSQRSTLAIDHNHPLRALAALGLADLEPPFFAGAKLPSAKHSSQRTLSWSLSWANKARHSSRNTPLSSHAFSRRQHVLGLPYRSGSTLHGAPVHRIHKIPSKHRRSSTRGRPPFLPRLLAAGRWSRIFFHCASLCSCHALPPLPSSPSTRGVIIPQFRF